MPELPEVEVVKKSLTNSLINSKKTLHFNFEINNKEQ